MKGKRITETDNIAVFRFIYSDFTEKPDHYILENVFHNEIGDIQYAGKTVGFIFFPKNDWRHFSIAELEEIAELMKRFQEEKEKVAQMV